MAINLTKLQARTAEVVVLLELLPGKVGAVHTYPNQEGADPDLWTLMLTLIDLVSIVNDCSD